MATEDEARSRPSYEKINYSLRPAKAIERRMLCEVFRRLYPFQPVEEYGYIGLGSIYFTDFQLIHRDLGITELISIERDRENEERFRLNLPLGCIDSRFAESKEILPNLDWSKRRIVWLDYDDKLNGDILADVGTVTSRCFPGSMLVLSVNGQPDSEPAEEQRQFFEKRTGEKFNVHTHRLQELLRRLEGKVPKSVNGKDLRADGLARTSRHIILNEISAHLAVRNTLLPPEEKILYKQVIYFHYRDGVLMTTIGVIFYEHRQEEVLSNCRFSELGFVRADDEPCYIKAPCLTPRETHYLNSFLPSTDITAINRYGIPSADVKSYSEVYRYFPTFNEVIFT